MVACVVDGYIDCVDELECVEAAGNGVSSSGLLGSMLSKYEPLPPPTRGGLAAPIYNNNNNVSGADCLIIFKYETRISSVTKLNNSAKMSLILDFVQ